MDPPPPPPSGGAPPPPPGTPWQAPPTTAAERVRWAASRRWESDYIFEGPGLNVFLTVITCGIFGLYLFYQLMRRDRDHLQRRYDLMEAANRFAWERASEQGIAEELRPAFERTAANLEVMRRQTFEFRDPAIWVIISLFASGIAQIVGFVFIDQDLDTHDRAEGALEDDLADIYERLGLTLPRPDPSRVKGKHSYPARIIVTIVTCGIYLYWWLYDMQVEGNAHLVASWPVEDALVAAVSTPTP